MNRRPLHKPKLRQKKKHKLLKERRRRKKRQLLQKRVLRLVSLMQMMPVRNQR